MDEISKIGWAIALIFNLLLGWAVWSLRSAFVPRGVFDELGTRVSLIERDMTHLPSPDDFAQLRAAVAKLDGQAAAQQQLLNRIASSVTRIEDYLLKAKQS